MTLSLFNEPIHRAVGTAALFGLVISLPGTLGFIATGWNDPRLPPGSLGYVSLVGFIFIAPTTVPVRAAGREARARLLCACLERRLRTVPDNRRSSIVLARYGWRLTPA